MIDRSVLLIDDDASFLKVYSKILETKGYHVQTAPNGEKGLKIALSKNFSVIIADMVMPVMNGLELLKAIKEYDPDIQVMLLTGVGSIPGAVEAMRLGAYNYLLKPVDVGELLLNVDRAFQLYGINQENRLLRSELKTIMEKHQLLGESAAVKEIKEKINIIAESNATVLITGESGTGKEIVANLIHNNSTRSGKPMIKVNCAALAESVLESELFGHEKGAFTGALNLKKGRFEMANGTTLFLDEIGELTLNTQTKLLRVLQEKEFERVGGGHTIQTDFRLIAATNKNLVDEIAAGRFREDLYYRINVIPIHIPSLRERKEDVRVLLNHFIQSYGSEMRKETDGFEKEVLDMLSGYPWPGNVRELKNLVERLMVLSKNKTIHASDLPEEYRKSKADSHEVLSYQQAKRAFEERFIRQALQECGGNITLAARRIGIARKNLQIKMKELGLRDNATQE